MQPMQACKKNTRNSFPRRCKTTHTLAKDALRSLQIPVLALRRSSCNAAGVAGCAKSGGSPGSHMHMCLIGVNNFWPWALSAPFPPQRYGMPCPHLRLQRAQGPAVAELARCTRACIQVRYERTCLASVSSFEGGRVHLPSLVVLVCLGSCSGRAYRTPSAKTCKGVLRWAGCVFVISASTGKISAKAQQPRRFADRFKSQGSARQPGLYTYVHIYTCKYRYMAI